MFDIFSTIMDIILWDFLILYQIFFSPQVKRSIISSSKHDIRELPYKLPNGLRLIKKPIKLFYLLCSYKRVVEKSHYKKLKVIKNTLPDKSGNLESLKQWS